MPNTAGPEWEFTPNHCPCNCDLDPSWQHVEPSRTDDGMIIAGYTDEK